MWVEGRVLDGGSVEVDVDLVVSWSSDAVFDVVGSVSVVSNGGGDGLGSTDGHFEGISSSVDSVAVWVHSGDSEGKNVVCLSSVESRSFSERLGGVTLLNEWVEGRSLDVLSGQSDGDGVESRGWWDIPSSVSSVSVVLEVNVDGSRVVANDFDVERIVSSWDWVSVLVLGLDGEGRVLADSGSSSLNTRSGGGGVVSVGSRDGGRVGASLNGLSAEGDGDVVGSDGDGGVGDGVESVSTVVLVEVNGLSGTVGDVDGELVSANDDGVTEVVDGVDGEGSSVVGVGLDESRSISEALRGIGHLHSSKALGFFFLSASSGFVVPVVTEERDVGHDGEFIGHLNQIDGVHQLSDLEFSFSSVHSSLGILESVSRETAVVEGSGLERVSEGGEDLSVSPVHVEVLGLKSIGSDLLSDPLQELSLGVGVGSSSLDLESKNESPDETQNELEVLVVNIFRSNTDELDSLSGNELEGRGDVFELLWLHLRGLVVLSKTLVGKDFQKGNQQDTIRKVL